MSLWNSLRKTITDSPRKLPRIIISVEVHSALWFFPYIFNPSSPVENPVRNKNGFPLTCSTVVPQRWYCMRRTGCRQMRCCTWGGSWKGTSTPRSSFAAPTPQSSNRWECFAPSSICLLPRRRRWEGSLWASSLAVIVTLILVRTDVFSACVLGCWSVGVHS